MVLPGGVVIKGPPANARDIRDVGSIPRSGRSPGGVRDSTFGFPFLIFYPPSMFLLAAQKNEKNSYLGCECPSQTSHGTLVFSVRERKSGFYFQVIHLKRK